MDVIRLPEQRRRRLGLGIIQGATSRRQEFQDPSYQNRYRGASFAPRTGGVGRGKEGFLITGYER